MAEDVTKHPLWHIALCDVCGKPYKLEDLTKKAEAIGLQFVEERRRFYFYCCYELTLDDNELYAQIIELLRQYHRM